MASSKRGLAMTGAVLAPASIRERVRRWVLMAVREAQRISEHGFRAFIS
jgi:hypothetical protein